MANLDLTPEDHNILTLLVQHTSDSNLLRRALAVLWYAEKQPVSHIAKQLRVSNTAVYKWINFFLDHAELSVVERLSELPRGRPRKPPEERMVKKMLAGTISTKEVDKIISDIERPKDLKSSPDNVEAKITDTV